MRGGSKKNFDFFFVGGQRQGVGNIKPLYISKKLLPLYMDYELEIHNRIKIGFAIGFQHYGKDEDYDWSELTIFLGLINIVIKYS